MRHLCSKITDRWIYDDLMNESAISQVISVLFWPLLCLARMKLTRWPGSGLWNGNEPFHREHGNFKISNRNFCWKDKARGQECAPETVNTSCQYGSSRAGRLPTLCTWAFPFWVLVVYGGIDMSSSPKLNSPRSLINPPDGKGGGRYSTKF